MMPSRNYGIESRSRGNQRAKLQPLHLFAAICANLDFVLHVREIYVQRHVSLRLKLTTLGAQKFRASSFVLTVKKKRKVKVEGRARQDVQSPFEHERQMRVCALIVARQKPTPRRGADEWKPPLPSRLIHFPCLLHLKVALTRLVCVCVYVQREKTLRRSGI